MLLEWTFESADTITLDGVHGESVENGIDLVVGKCRELVECENGAEVLTFRMVRIAKVGLNTANYQDLKKVSGACCHRH